MQQVRRTAYSMVLVAIAPLLVFGVLQISAALSAERTRVEARTLDRARLVMTQIDGALRADLGALSVLAGGPTIQSLDPEQSLERARETSDRRPAWKNVVLADAADGRVLWETDPSGAPSTVAANLPGPLGSGSVGDVRRYSEPCMCIALHDIVQGDDGRSYTLSVERSVDDFQTILLGVLGRDEVGAVVDRPGNFISRSLDYESRIGTPATEYVRAAVDAGVEGLYTGVTYEGLRNRTAYYASPLSGWSAHVAVPSQRLTLLEAGSAGFTLLGAVVALALAGALVWISMRSVRRRRLAEQARFQSQKMEALGQLAGGVAHDFNNLLAILASVHKRMKDYVADPKGQALLEQCDAAVERGTTLTRQLLTFSRAKTLDIECVNLETCVGQMQELLKQSLGAGVSLHVSLGRDMTHVRTNAAQLELVLINLAVNARDAMPDGGRFEIVSRPAMRAGWVDLVVRDNGPGMTEDVRARAAEPFFTTKPEGKGTGLGLAQAHTLAIQSGGEFEIDSQPGQGACFIFTLEKCAPEDVAGPQA